jgi:biopolymer transport protein ExbB
MITEQISMFAFYAARGIMLLLLVLSVFSVTFFLERLIFSIRHFLNKDENIFAELEAADSLKSIRAVLKKNRSAETRVVLKGLSDQKQSSEAFEKKVSAYAHTEKVRWERFSLFLGSVGSNAPFLGLLGTVLGILKSFADLGLSTKGGPAVVMAGISEALVVTAVGLVVAIPAVLFFNICKRRVDRAMGMVASMVDLISAKDLFLNREPPR